MTATFSRATSDDLHAFVAGHIESVLRRELERAGVGHRLRVSTLPETVMVRLCERLGGDPRWCVRILTASAQPETAVHVTATKLIELRNVHVGPLLVFIPTGAQTAAADSFDIATFNELTLYDALAPAKTYATLLRDLHEDARAPLERVIEILQKNRRVASADDLVSYLLTVRRNGATPEAVGGALFELGLVPDFNLVARGDLERWLRRNGQMIDLLADTARPLRQRLTRLRLVPGPVIEGLFSLLRNYHADPPRMWLPALACTPEGRALSLDRWPFSETGDPTELRLTLEPLSLPMQKAEPGSDAVSLPVFDLKATKGALKVSFRSSPAPSEVPSWTTWRVQILNADPQQPGVVWESSGFAKPANPRKAISRSLKASDLEKHLEPGVYYLRVDAYTETGLLLTSGRSEGDLALRDSAKRPSNESGPFIVTTEGSDEDVDVPEPRSIFVTSLIDAWVQINTRSDQQNDLNITNPDQLRGTWSEPTGRTARGDAHFLLEGAEAVAGYTVRVPSSLRGVEECVLKTPDHLGSWKLSLHASAREPSAPLERGTSVDLPARADAQAFIAARRAVFLRLRGGEEGRGLVETADLFASAREIELYADAWISLAERLCEEEGSGSLAVYFAHLDVIEVHWHGAAGDPGRALLLGPTHPLRLLWHLQHANVLAHAMQAFRTQTAAADSWTTLFERLRKEVLPLNLPLVMFDDRGRGYAEHGPLTSHWTLYLPDRAYDRNVDVATSRDRLRKLLGLKGSGPSTELPTDHLAARVMDYLQQHPYCEQLKLQVFNPGDGALVSAMLRQVEKARREMSPRGEAPALRYVVQLFGAAEHLDAMGTALDALLDPDRQVEEEDEFALLTANHLQPKLIVARNATEDFLRTPERFKAHVALLLEQFAALARVGSLRDAPPASWLSGLLHESTTLLVTEGATYGWNKLVHPVLSVRADVCERLLAQALRAQQRLEAWASLRRRPEADDAPILGLQLDPAARALLRLVHENNDWVFTLDRNLGIDFFDRSTRDAADGYLLDFSPEYLHGDHQRLLVTTRCTSEFEALLRPAYEDLGCTWTDGDGVALLETLRSVSGRLALRLRASSAHAKEVLGVAFARLALDAAGVSKNLAIVPLDAHQDWFWKQENARGGDLWHVQRRADLLLVGVDPKMRRVVMTVVEIKLRRQLDETSRSALFREMREQAESTLKVLRQRFDPNRFGPPRADAALCAKELSSVLSFYLERSHRYGLVDAATVRSSVDFLRDLGTQYDLETHARGVLFDMESTKEYADDREAGITVLCLGHDVAESLLAEARARFAEPEGRSTKRVAAEESLRTLRDVMMPYGEMPGPSMEVAVQTQGVVDTPGKTPLPAEPAPVVETVVEPASRQENEPGEAPPPEPMPTPASITVAVGTIPETVSRVALDPNGLLGASEATAQYGALGRCGRQLVTLDLMGCNTISLFGVQGFGKSYTLGVIAEMSSVAVPGINVLPAPLATVVFHYHKSDAYAPEYAAATVPNQKSREVTRLLEEYGARPAGLNDVVILTPEARVEDRRREFPTVEVMPIKFGSGEIGNRGWKFLMGAVGNDALYIRQIEAIMKRHRTGLTLAKLREEVARGALSDRGRQLAEERFSLAEQYICDDQHLSEIVRPGRTIIVDLRDEWVEKEEALGLFVVLMDLFTRSNTATCNKLMVFDEAHKFMSESDLIGEVVEMIREMRHRATSVVIASQDPLSVPRAVIELTSVLVLHRMTSPQWLKHLKNAISSLEELTDAQVAGLQPGEALVWAQRSTDKRFTLRPQKIAVRPRFTRHGGHTKTAVEGKTVR